MARYELSNELEHSSILLAFAIPHEFVPTNGVHGQNIQAEENPGVTLTKHEKCNESASQKGSPSLDGETRIFVIIGDPVGQVKSPGILSANLAARGHNALVVPGHVRPDRVDDFMSSISCCLNFDGIIATIPHKQAVMRYCKKISERARYAGSVNVLWRQDDGWSGDNTDGEGYVNGIEAAGGVIEEKRVLLIGAGGAGSAIAYEFLDRGANFLAIHDVDTKRRDELISRLEVKFPGKIGIGTDDPTGYDVVGNATPLGMREADPLPVICEKLEETQFVADVITRPEISPLIEIAGSKGCMTMPGIQMFKAQEDLLVEALLGKTIL